MAMMAGHHTDHAMAMVAGHHTDHAMAMVAGHQIMPSLPHGMMSHQSSTTVP